MKKLRGYTLSFVAAMIFGLFAASAATSTEVQASNLPAPHIRLFGDSVLNWEVADAPAGAIIVIYADGGSIFASTEMSSGMTLPGWNIPGEGPRALNARIITLDGQIGPLSDTVHWAWTVNAEQLTLPTNLRVDGDGILRWNAVSNAALYTFGASWGVNFEGWYGAVTTDNFIDLSFLSYSENLSPGQAVMLSVFASAPDFMDSAANIIFWTMPETPPPGGQLQIPGNLRVDGGSVLMWNPVARATTYDIFVNGVFEQRTTQNFWYFGVNPWWALPGQSVHLSVIARADDFADSPANVISWTRPSGPLPPTDSMRHVHVEDSWALAGATGGGPHHPGSLVTIHAGHRPGFDFLGWFVHHPQHPALVLAQPHSSTTTFIMPNSNVHVRAFWWRHGDPMPGFPWWPWPETVRTPGINWQVRNIGGVSFNYAAGDFPETLAVGRGSTVNFRLRVDRHLAPRTADFVGQWLRNGAAHGATFPIALSHAGFADVDLRIPSVTAAAAGDYSLRVATVVNGITTHVDTSGAAALSVVGEAEGADIWPGLPELPPLPAVNPMPTPRPNLAFAPPGAATVTGRAALPAAPAHNHDMVTHSPDGVSAVLQIMPGTSEVRLYGRTLDALIDSNTTLFVAGGLVWTVMPPDFLAHLRYLGGNFIGPSGGTFNIGINETRGGATLVTAQIDITTTINGQTRPLTDFGVPYSLAVELWDFGMAGVNPNHITVLHENSRLPGHLNTQTGVLSFSTTATGSFDVNYIIN
ncbi:MAG: hypothetical protein LBE55_00620 [Clostridiales bacterium]|jgi:hypothetical protein|nr:hypothetical protein [Clostridiales bacterium]